MGGFPKAPAAAPLALALALGWCAGGAAAQNRAREPFPAGSGAVAWTVPDLPVSAGAPSAYVALRSLAVPGWGQWVLGQRRGIAYAALEASLWIAWVERRARAGELRDRYRDLAWTSARLAHGPRRDGPWAYYEHLTRWMRSGVFDRDPGTPGVQPEEDPDTFNGRIWSLALSIHGGGGTAAPGDPGFPAALAWYGERAYGDGYLWDWTGKEPQLAEFRRLIDESDQRFRQATTALGAVLANHVLSATDAFLSSRTPLLPEARLAPQGPARDGPALQLLLTWRRLP